MSAKTVAFVGSLVDAHPSLRSILDEHLIANEGAVLPHLLVSDVERWAEAEMAAKRVEPGSELRKVLAFLESAFAPGAADVDDEISELISVSFLEHLPRPGVPGDALRLIVGPACNAQLGIIG